MAKYVDLSLGTDSHAGTDVDPYSWVDFQTAVTAKTDTIYYLKGLKNATDWLTWPVNKTGFEFHPWNASINGPYRIQTSLTDSALWGLWEGGIVVNTGNNTFIYDNISTMFLSTVSDLQILQTATFKGCTFKASDVVPNGNTLTFNDCIMDVSTWRADE